MFRLTLRNLMARKVRLVMSTLAIVLGMGFLAGVMTFSHGLGATFDNILNGSTSAATVRQAGDSDLQNSGMVSTTATLSPADVAKLAALPEVGQADGSVDGFGSSLLGKDGKLVGGQGAPTLAFNYFDGKNLDGKEVLLLDSGAWPGANEIVLDPRSADRGDYKIGDQVSVIVPNAASIADSIKTFTLSGTASLNGGGTAGATIMIFDTPTAQALFLGGKDAFTTVALAPAAGVSQQELAAAAKKVVPKGFTAITGDQQVKEGQDQLNQILGVFSTFLLVFAGIAILVGGFIIFNTFSILVGQRVRESALLRALGASKKQVTRSVLVEAFVMGLVGSTLGLGVGWLLARGLAALMRSFGLDIASGVLVLTPGTIASAYIVGILVTMAAAYFPARRASKVAPVAALRDDLVVQEKSLRGRTLIGGIAALVGVGLAAVGLAGGPGNDAIWIGAAAVIWVVTAAVLAPVIGKPVLIACRAVFGKVFGTTGRLAAENAMRSPRRTGATASALMIGLAVVSAIGVLATSLNKTYDDLIDSQFASDFLVQSATFQAFPPAIGDEMAKVPGVGVLSRGQAAPAQVDGEMEFLLGVDDKFGEVYHLDMLKGTESMSGDQAIVNQSTAKSLDLKVGSTLPLNFPGGSKAGVKVVGVFKDTPITAGITVPLSVLEDAGIKRGDNSLSINVAPGANVDEVHKALSAVIKDLPIVSVQDKQEFAQTAKGQINQLLFFIYGLLLLAIIIAIFGIVNTLGLSVLERTREIGLLRAVGLSRKRLRRTITLESVSISLLGAILGLGVGLVIGILLRQSLSDDITSLGIPIGSLIVFLILAVIIGVLAAIIPAIRASRLKVLDAIASE